LEADKGIERFTVLHGQNIDLVSLEEKWIQELLKK
jgi:hypothetical protein